MATRISYTQAIPGIKVSATDKADADAYLGQLTAGEIIEADGELYFKATRNATEATPVGQGLVAEGTLTTAQVKALNATPISLIAAPGAGKLIVVDEVQLFLDYGSAAYVAAAGEDLDILYAGSSEIMQIDTDGGFITATADAYLIAKPTVYDCDAATTANGFVATANVNKAVNITVLTGELATGDSPVSYKIKYRIVDVVL